MRTFTPASPSPRRDIALHIRTRYTSIYETLISARDLFKLYNMSYAASVIRVGK
jgi:hypothetical protein